MNKRALVALLIGVSFSCLGFSAEETPFQKGKQFFLKGQFREATQCLLKTDVMLGEDSLSAQSYLLAMSEKPLPVRDEVTEFIARQAERDIIYKILSARLALQGGEQDALEKIETLGMKSSYAGYTLGLYYSGALGVGKENKEEALAMYSFSGMRGFVRSKEWVKSLEAGRPPSPLFSESSAVLLSMN